MIRVSTIAEVREAIAAARQRGARVGFVPTMGFLHEGHLRLVDAARQRADLVVMSVFVNPLQFSASEDLSRYPRDIERDALLAASRGVDVLFTPGVDEMYPPGRSLAVDAGPVANLWEGAVRPGHFAGVLTVVLKLFNIVAPDVTCFGQKDIQQVTLVRALIREFDLPVELHVEPIARDTDGLALSSRNVYLTELERSAALALPRALERVSAAWRNGERSSNALAAIAQREFASEPLVVPDYIAIIDPDRLEPVAIPLPGTIVALAARVGRTRLIDNVILKDQVA